MASQSVNCLHLHFIPIPPSLNVRSSMVPPLLEALNLIRFREYQEQSSSLCLRDRLKYTCNVPVLNEKAHLGAALTHLEVNVLQTGRCIADS